MYMVPKMLIFEGQYKYSKLEALQYANFLLKLSENALWP